MLISYYFVTLFSYSGTFVHCKSALKWMGEVVWEGAGMISHSVVHRSSAQVVMCSCSPCTTIQRHPQAPNTVLFLHTHTHTMPSKGHSHIPATYVLQLPLQLLAQPINISYYFEKKTSFSHFPPSLHSWCIKKRRLSRK